ncbi:MAG: TM0106 family RecB-like putative nuclease [Patescibacteria group bacterium]
MTHITASKLYNYLQCQHRVWRDIYGPQNEKIKEANPFVELLWDKGIQHEKNVVSKLGKFTDFSGWDYDDAAKETIKAMERGDELIYQGVLKYGDMMGIPDLLRRQADGSYLPIDIKAGSGLEGETEETEGKIKKHYAVQLCLYVELLKNLKFTNKNKGLIIDIRESEVEYDLDSQVGPKTPKTWWQIYLEIKDEVKVLIDNKKQNLPANAGICKLCPWYNSCKKWLKESDDLTNIFYLGRGKRDVICDELGVNTVKDICTLDLAELKNRKKLNKTFLPGIGDKTMDKIMCRANILAITKKPVLYQPISFPDVSFELFFDIEDDPTQEFVYLHGVYERHGGEEKFIDFTAKDNTPEAEKEAWMKFWDYIRNLPKDDFAVYYYSHHEKTTYKKMQERYPEAISLNEVEKFFDHPNVVDLYKIILQQTDWPLGSYSLKEIVQYLGFKWRDETPSGALSIQWFNKYLETKDPKDLERILLYNEDDCKATMILKDALVKMSK